MDSLSKDLIELLTYLLPGFVSAWIFFNLTSFPKPSQFERVIQALIFTLFIQAIVNIVMYLYSKIPASFSFTEWKDSYSLVTSIFIAVLIGVIFSYYSNNDKFHKFLRKRNITRESSFPSEWFGAFIKDVTYVVLHFKDERRLYGWPIEWPSEPTKGHFVIADPSWQGDDGEELRITGVKNILVDVNDIKWVEFLDKTWENDNG